MKGQRQKVLSHFHVWGIMDRPLQVRTEGLEGTPKGHAGDEACSLKLTTGMDWDERSKKEKEARCSTLRSLIFLTKEREAYPGRDTTLPSEIGGRKGN